MSILKELIALREEAEPESTGDNVVELTTFKGDRIPYEAWTEGVMYKGMNVYNTVYEGKGEKTLAADFEHLIKKPFEDDEGGALDAQEVYLGYSPHKDLFVMGYDGHASLAEDADSDESDDEEYDDNQDFSCSPYLAFKITNGGSVDNIDYDFDMAQNGKAWYGKNGGRDTAKRRWPDLIDIRLD